jgi:hypothetical protein
MSNEKSEDDMEQRTVVKTYIPKYQKEMWSEHANKLNMSQSEFVRCMVQAGREVYEVDQE